MRTYYNLPVSRVKVRLLKNRLNQEQTYAGISISLALPQKWI